MKKRRNILSLLTRSILRFRPTQQSLRKGFGGTLIALILMQELLITTTYAQEAHELTEVVPRNNASILTDTEKKGLDFMQQSQTGIAALQLDLDASSRMPISAAKEVPAVVRKLEKESYRTMEKVKVTIENAVDKNLTIELLTANNKEVGIAVDTKVIGTTEVLTINQPNQFRPGAYKLQISDEKGGMSEQNFTWGVLALNPDKSVYAPQETARLSIAVLDEIGDMVCDAQVELKITDPGGKTTSLSTDNGKVGVNPQCESHAVSMDPDYGAVYKLGEEGTYAIHLKSQTRNGLYSIQDEIKVSKTAPFSVKRTSATRIYPPNEYPVTMEIVANQDFTGTVTETVPASFKIGRPGEEVLTEKEEIEQIILEKDQDVQVEEPQPTQETKTVPAVTGPDVLGISDELGGVLGYTSHYNLADNNVATALLSADVPRLEMPFSGPFPISQEFGEHLVRVHDTSLYEEFGMKGHDGVDFALPMGTPVLAVDDGEIVRDGEGDYGTTVIIQHSWGKTYYGHLSEVTVKNGQKVTRGSVVGASGNSGISTGPHLHFGVRPNKDDAENGYYGKVDPGYYLGLKQKAGTVLAAATRIDKELEIQTTSDVQVLTWRVDIKKGETITLGYNYLAPLISPQFYTLGPATFTDTSGHDIFQENRKWQIAADAVGGDQMTQEDYRWYKNINVITPTTALEDENTRTIIAKNKATARLRMNISDGDGLAASGDKFKLQYAATSSDTTTPTDWCNDTSGISCTAPGETSTSAPTDWCNDTTTILCNTSWESRRKITIDNTDATENLTEFPLLVKLDSTRIDYSKTMANGEDLRFVDPADKTSVLHHEIESWNESGTSYVWVNVPQVDDSATDYIWMYYDNSSATDGQNPASVWNSGYVGVWHLDENPTVSNLDSTANNNDGTAGGSMTSGDSVTGKISNSLDFDGSDDNINAASGGTLDDLTNITYSAWIDPTTFGDGNLGRIVDKGTGSTGWGAFVCNNVTNGTNTWCWYTGRPNTTDGWWNAPGSSISTGGGFYHTAVTFNFSANTNDPTMYTNGVSVAVNESQTPAGTFGSDAALNLHFGDRVAGDRSYAGLIDEVRISNVIRSASWIRSEYESGMDTLNTFGSEESVNGTSDTGWSYRTKITFNNSASSENLTNFPVLVKVNSSRINYARTNNDGSDIRFVDAGDPNTVLPHEIESWNESGYSYVWVKVPQINTGSTTDYIWMYYGNSSASDGQDATNVWNSNFKIVHHLNESGSPYEDSTTNNKDGSAASNAPTATTAKVDGGQNFDGTNDKYTVATPGFPTTDFTAGAWVKVDSLTAENILDLSDSTGADNEFNINIDTGTFDLQTNGAFRVASTTAISTGQYYYVLATRTSTTLRLYVNGTLQGTTATDGTAFSFGTCALVVGADHSTGACATPTYGDFFDGIIDEVRVSDNARSADWIEAEYITMSDTMNSFGTAENYSDEVPQGETSTPTDWCNDTTGITCDTDWSKRREITINNSASGTNLDDFPVLVKLDSTRIDYDYAQNNGEDLRFVDTSDATTVLPHEVESWNESGSSYVWVRVDLTANSSTESIYMYYGNGTAASGNDGTNVWDTNFKGVWHLNQALTSTTVFTDNFTRADSSSIGASYTERGGDFSISGNKITNAATTSTPSVAYISSSYTSGPDYYVEAKINFNGVTADTDDYPGVFGRRVNYSTSDSNYYLATLNDFNNEVEIWKRVSGTWTVLGATAFTINNSTDYTLRLNMSGTTLSAWVNGTKYVEITDSSLTAAGDAGISMGTNGNANMLWDDLTVGGPGQPLDSTSNVNHATSANMETGDQVTGQVNGSLDFDGSNERLSVNDSSSLRPTGAITLAAWIYPDGTTGLDLIFAKRRSGSLDSYHLALDSAQQRFCLEPSGGAVCLTTGGAVSATTWYYVTATWDGSTMRMYRNGAQVGSTASQTNTLDYTTDALYFATQDQSGTLSDWFDGKIDEGRISSTARSADWIEAEYLTMTDAMNTFGSEEDQTGEGAVEWKDVGGSANWCNDGVGVTCSTLWGSRIKITFNNSASTENLTDFPVLVKLNSSRIDYSKTKSSGEDIRFVDPGNNTVALNHEIETWNESGDSYVWVNVPQIDLGSRSDYIWMYYNNSGASSPAIELGATHATGLWNTNYRGVYHMPNGTTLSAADSSTRGNNGTVSLATATTGKIGGGSSYAGGTADNTIRLSNPADFQLTTGTVSTWVKTSSPGANERGIIVKQGAYLLLLQNSILVAYDWGGAAFRSTGNNLADGQWHHVAMSFQSGVASGTKIYIDGVLDTTTTITVSHQLSGVVLACGGQAAGNGNNCDQQELAGQMDETRISNTVRSEQWIEAEYITMNDAMNAFGVEENYDTNVVWSFKDNAGVSTGTTITSKVLTDSTSGNQMSYQESNPTVYNPTALAIGESREWDFVLNGNSAPTGTYYFRLITEDGYELANYTRYPSIILGVPNEKLMRNGKWFNYKTKQPFSF